MLTPDPRETLRFLDFELDVPAYQLRQEGRPVRLERQPMDLLILLVQRRSQLVSREEIIERLWGKDVFVDVETGVHTAIRKIRQALHDSTDAPRCVETVTGKGYRFIAPVETVGASPRGTDPSVPPEGAPQQNGATSERPPEPQPAPRARSSPAVVVGLLAAVALAGVASWVWIRGAAPPPRVTVAVLPFENLSGDADRDYLADGLAEETIASVGQIDPERLGVIGRTSTAAYKGTRKSLAEIGRELNVNYLIEGSIRAEGGRLRITSRLVRVPDQTQVWSASFDREPTSVVALQRELSTAIAGQIHLRLSPERLGALARRHTADAEAYDLYLRGRYFWVQLTPATNKRALEYFERAIAIDPEYALAWAGIASVLVTSPINSDVLPADVLSRVREASARAVRAAPDLSEAHDALGAFLFMLEWDWGAAEAAFRRSIALDPGDALAHRMLGHLLSQTGRQGEATRLLERARSLEPLYAMNHAISAQVAFQGRDFEGAAGHARHAIALDPEFWIGYAQLGQAAEQLGQYDLALEALGNAARFSGGNSKAMAVRGYLLAKLGRTGEAREVLNAMAAVARERYVPPYSMALVHAGLGERDAVFARLNEAYDARDVHLIFLPVDPKWDPYRDDPRFQALLKRCGFAGAPTAH
jgi:TolB-like protein/DNA-binding winged helix-turn-helix (wHTH) protein/tetratricopeptide (TPR) repeat protein